MRLLDQASDKALLMLRYLCRKDSQESSNKYLPLCGAAKSWCGQHSPERGLAAFLSNETMRTDRALRR